jgi:acyl-CoA reductase-like NAD-dependent aldehyde dehydrogenase
MRAAIHAADGRILHRAADELEKATPELVELLNGPTVHDEATVPFGGVKDSGMGREGGRWSIEEMTEVRWVTIHLG